MFRLGCAIALGAALLGLAGCGGGGEIVDEGESVATGRKLEEEACQFRSGGGETVEGESVATGRKLDEEEEVPPGTKFHMTDYYALWCHHSRDLAPVWKAAVEEFKKKHPGSELHWDRKQCGGEDGAPGKDAGDCLKAKINGLPTIRFSADDGTGQPGEEIAQFNDERTKEKILAFAEENLEEQEKKEEKTE